MLSVALPMAASAVRYAPAARVSPISAKHRSLKVLVVSSTTKINVRGRSRATCQNQRYVHVAAERRRALKPIAAAASASSAGGMNYGPVYVSVAAAALGAFCFGYHLAVLNGPLQTLAGQLGFAANTHLQGLTVSIALAGAAIGSLVGGNLAEAKGRRTALMIAAIPLMTGPFLSAIAADFTKMAIGRFLAGVGIGLASALVPLYVAEISPSAIRGALGSVNQLAINVGILGALVVNVLMPPTEWRLMFLLAMVPGALLLLGMLGSPESPRWLAAKGKIAEAQAAATKLWGAAGAAALGSSTAGGATPAGSWGELFSKHRRVAFIAMALFVFQQLSGINAIVYFSSSVFRQAGIESEALASASVGLVNLLGTLWAASIVDSLGRTTLLSRSYLGMGLFMLLLASGFGLPALQPYIAPIALAGTVGYILSFGFGAGPVTGAVIPELAAAKIRGLAVSLAFVTHWVFNFFIGQWFLPAYHTFGLAKVYLFFSVVSLVGCYYTSTQVPETKGKSLEQIEKEMQG